jgi:hypothetical protein
MRGVFLDFGGNLVSNDSRELVARFGVKSQRPIVRGFSRFGNNPELPPVLNFSPVLGKTAPLARSGEWRPTLSPSWEKPGLILSGAPCCNPT